MKGISVWIWVIAGIIIGMVMFTLFVQIMSYISISRDKENAKATIGEFAAVVNSFCDAHIGEKTVASFSFPSFVDVTFVSGEEGGHGENNETLGKWLCIKIEKEVSCEKLNCQLEMRPLEQKTNFLSLTDRLFGSSYQEYVFEIAKTEYGVSALQPGMSSDCRPLVKCNGKTAVAVFKSNLVIMSDFTPIFDCCSKYPKITTFLTNVAKFFGGKKIMIVWESNFANPDIDKYSPIYNALKADGFEIISFKHKQKLTLTDLQGVNQLWVYLPGWCSGQQDVKRTVECTEFVDWNKDEYDNIKDFLNSDGKLFIVSDYSPYTTQEVANDIISNLGQGSRILENKVCESGSNPVKTTDIKSHQITQGITEFRFLATSEIAC